jgi:hypothetical protein
VKEVYEDNHRFQVKKGKKYMKDGVLTFPKVNEKPDGFYRTRTKGILHNGVVYARSNHNLQVGVQRLCKSRGGSLEAHLRLLGNQERFLDTAYVRELEKRVLQRRIPVFEDLVNALQYMHEHYDDPHAKLPARYAAYHDLMVDGGIGKRIYTNRDGCVSALVKPGEWAKAGKVPRLFVNLGTPASLQGMGHAKAMKVSDAISDTIHGVRFIFIAAPSADDITQVFRELKNPPTRGTFFYFSDDSCLSLRDSDGKVHSFNIDISSCDSSHGDGVFRSMARTVPDTHKRDHSVVQDQLLLNLTLKSRGKTNEGIKPSVTLMSETKQLYSGSLFTTTTNNHGCRCMIWAIILFSKDHIGPITRENIVAWCAHAGYIVTVDVCRHFTDMQFLKHSPVLGEDGLWHAVLNLGVLLRAYGTANGDIPGPSKTPLAARAAAFDVSLLRGMYPRTNCELFDRLRATAQTQGKVNASTQRKIDAQVTKQQLHKSYATTKSDTDTRTYTMEALLLRYRYLYNIDTQQYDTLFDDGDAASFTANYGSLRFGEFWNCKVSNAILALDYKLSGQTEPRYLKYLTPGA